MSNKTCSCSLKAKPNAVTQNRVLVIHTSPFQLNGNVGITKTGNSFIDLAYSVPFLASSSDSYITSLVSKQLIINFEPTYFQCPFIYS
jgi:hypothetical protein